MGVITSLNATTRANDAARGDALMDELASVRGAALVAVFDAEGVCRAMRRSPLICALGTYRVLSELSNELPGRSKIVRDVDGRVVFARRLHDGAFAMITTSGLADEYETEVRLIDAVAGHALRASSAPPPPVRRAVSSAVPTMPIGLAPPIIDDEATVRTLVPGAAPVSQSVTIPPPAGRSPSELPPIEASLVLALGSLEGLYRGFADEVDVDQVLTG